MAAPTAQQISAAYNLVAQAEKAAITTLKEKSIAFLADLDSAMADLPVNVVPQSAGLNNLNSWRNTVQSIVSSIDSILSQYPTEPDA